MAPPRSRPGLLATLLLAGASACGPPFAEGPSPDVEVVEVWYHAGQLSERSILEEQVRRFNDSQDSLRVTLVFLPEGAYNGQVQASAVAGQLPDLLDADGPYVASYAWKGYLRPLGRLLPDSTLSDLLPSLVEQGTFRGELYGVGTFDSGLGLYASRNALDEAGARIPTGPEDAWTASEFTELLDDLAARDDDGAVLDLRLNDQGEWVTYAFQPILRSAGGGLVAVDGAVRAGGVLDGSASVRALTVVQRWIGEGRVDPNLDEAAFTAGRTALSWSGHWDYERYAEALGDDLLLLPLPDFGEGSRTGQGSWVWTIPASSPRPEAAAAFLHFLLQPDEVLAISGANGAVPATRTAAERSGRFGPGGALHLYVRQLEGGYAVPRPRTPAYPFVTSIFQEAFLAVRNGEPVQAILSEAAAAVDREIRDNEGYPPS